MKAIYACLFTTLILFTSAAHAQVMFMPWIGYETGNWESGSSSTDLSGYDFGVKVGVDQGPLNFGVEYALGKVTIDHSSGDTDVDLTDVGLFAMYKFSALSVWAEYIFNANAETEGGSDYDGTGIKLGLSVQISPPVALILEKVSREYDEINGSNLSQDQEIDSFIIGFGLVF